MPVLYRLFKPIPVVIQEMDSRRLDQLPAGSEVVCADEPPDQNGMVNLTYENTSLLVFLCDLEDRAEAIAHRAPTDERPGPETISKVRNKAKGTTAAR
jgi:hypothetical protein